MFANNTRFNPTVNGYLHLGHLYTALVNQAEAHKTGGKFGVRLDDTQRYWNWYCGAKVDEYAEEMRLDLDYFGIKYDYWITQSERLPMVEEMLRREFRFHIAGQPFEPEQSSEVVGADIRYYPYTPTLTPEKVVFDWLEHITYLVRGFDLITEDSLYRYFLGRFDLPPMRMAYIPRLRFSGDVVSKTEGKFKLRDYRLAGEDPQLIIRHLAYDCLKTGTSWRVDNIKDAPVLGDWAEGVLYAVHPG